MQRTIWKFDLEVADRQEIDMPAGSEILSVANVDAKLRLWAIVGPGEDMLKRVINIAGTGHPAIGVHDKANHIGTVIAMGGRLVWHVFDGGWAK